MALDVKEKDIQKAILHYLRLRGYLCKRNNAGMAFSEYNGKKRAFIVGESGWPDIEGLRKDGKYFGIEVKSKTGRLTPGQKIIGALIAENGGTYLVARSVDDVIHGGF